MTARKLRAAVTAILLGTAAAGGAALMLAAPAQALTASPKVGPLLKEAVSLINAKNYSGAKSKLNEAEAAASTPDAVQRFVELAPAETRKGVQAAMAELFRGAVAQVLLKKSGGGQIAAREVLLATAPVARAIGEGQLNQLTLALEAGRKHGMVSFTDALADFVRSATDPVVYTATISGPRDTAGNRVEPMSWTFRRLFPSSVTASSTTTKTLTVSFQMPSPLKVIALTADKDAPGVSSSTTRTSRLSTAFIRDFLRWQGGRVDERAHQPCAWRLV